MGKKKPDEKSVPKGILKNKKNKGAKSKGPAKGQGSEKEQPPQGMKKPAAVLNLGNLKENNEQALCLEDKMAAFNKKANGNVNEFLNGLTQGQREALWGRFSRARESLKDEQVNSLWNQHCKGKGSDEKKKKLLEIFLKNKGDLKKGQAFQKELISLTETIGLLVAHLANPFCLMVSCLFLLRNQRV